MSWRIRARFRFIETRKTKEVSICYQAAQPDAAVGELDPNKAISGLGILNRAMVYSWEVDSWTFHDLPNISHVARGETFATLRITYEGLSTATGQAPLTLVITYPGIAYDEMGLIQYQELTVTPGTTCTLAAAPTHLAYDPTGAPVLDEPSCVRHRHWL